MLITLTNREYFEHLKNKTNSENSRTEIAIPVTIALSQKWLGRLKGAQISVMLFVLNRTILVGKAAQVMSLKEFEVGEKDRDAGSFCGVGYSKNSIIEALKLLESEDLLIVYRTISGDSGAENQPRIYEINFKKVLEGGSDFGGGSPDFGGAPYIYHRYIDTDKETRHSSSTSRPNGPRDSVRKSRIVFPKTLKPKPKAVRREFATAEDAIAAVATTHAATRTARISRAATTAAYMLDKLSMQAIMDKVTTEISLGYRLIVTAKEHGFLRKRLKENPPADFYDFIRWVVTYWGTLASQNHKAVSRSKERITNDRRMPEAPSFTTLVYWYPYFFRAYQNHQAGKQASAVQEAEKDDKDHQIQQLRRMLQDTQNSARRLVIANRRKPVKEEQEVKAKPAVLRRRPAASVDLDEDDGFKPWGQA